jgi:hypothetical protein
VTPTGFLDGMADLQMSVVRATDPERYLASDQLIWFSEP